MLSNKNSNFKQDRLSWFYWKSMVHEKIITLLTKIILINQVEEQSDQEKAKQNLFLDKMLISMFSHANSLLLKCLCSPCIIVCMKIRWLNNCIFLKPVLLSKKLCHFQRPFPNSLYKTTQYQRFSSCDNNTGQANALKRTIRVVDKLAWLCCNNES